MNVIAEIAGRSVLLRSLADIQRALDVQTLLAKADLLQAKKQGRPVPPIYKSGVRYQREPIGGETWLLPSEAWRARKADCEDLATWRAAELQLKGQPARATATQVRPGLVHIYVVGRGGKREDPSYRLGMGRP